MDEQLELFNNLKTYYQKLPFDIKKKDGLRYFLDNNAFVYCDGIILYCMVRHLQPKRIIEVGSGYSSCLILDTNKLYFNNEIQCTFIEPYPQLLLSLINVKEKVNFEIIQKNLQDIELGKFMELSAGDILFIDSTHVSKVNSDVNYIFSKILPSLKSCVFIHFHDIYYPFEYPKEWFYEGRAWNEAYVLRAFLQYNNAFKIIFFNSLMGHFYKNKFDDEMPLCVKNFGGSIWLKKL